MLDDRAAFKAGFLQKCAEAGLTTEETATLASATLEQVKQAGLLDILQSVAAKPYNTALDVTGNVATQLGTLGLYGGLAIPPALGALGGFGAAKLTDTDSTDVDTMRKKELAQEYRTQAERLRKRKKKYRLPA